MPYKDPTRQRTAAREWLNARRSAWLGAQRCHWCGDDDELHIFGAPKGAFSARLERMERLLAGVLVLCDVCAEARGVERREAAEARERERRRLAAREHRARERPKPSARKPDKKPTPRPAPPAPAPRSRTACKSCGASLLWCKTDKGRAMPLDAAPNPAGNVAVFGDRCSTLTNGEKERMGSARPFYMPHFVTCTDAQAWRTKAQRGQIKMPKDPT